jgi:RNA polymerase sigma-70 factor (ECF subfamily)
MGGSGGFGNHEYLDDRMPNPQQMAEWGEASQFLQDGLEALSPELKEAIILRDLEEMTYQEISDY